MQQDVNTPLYLCQIVNSDLYQEIMRVVQIGGQSVRQYLGPFEGVIVTAEREGWNNCCRLKETPCDFDWVVDQKPIVERTLLGP